MRLTLFALLAASLLCWSTPARAQQVQLDIRDGVVSLKVQDAPLQAILSEWARIGGTTIVSTGRLAETPLTLDLKDLSEGQALDIVLRNVGGYLLRSRLPGSNAASLFDRVLILPGTVASQDSPSEPTNGAARQELLSLPRAPVDPPEDPKDTLHSVPPSPVEAEGPKDTLYSMPPSPVEPEGPKDTLHSMPPSRTKPEGRKDTLGSGPPPSAR